MNATDARRLTDEMVRAGADFSPFLAVAHLAIERAAKCGKSSIRYPPDWGRTPGPDYNQDRAVLEALRGEGYRVTVRPCASPGHPASHAYTVIEW